MERCRVADNKTFVDGIAHLMDEVSIFHDGHLIDESFVEHIFVGFLGSGDDLILVGKHLHAGSFHRLIEGWHDRGVEGLVEDDTSGSAVGDASAIESKDISAVALQVQFLG